MGDKTQLLAIVLAARFGRPLPIMLGILAATLLNHAAAAAFGYLAAQWLSGPAFQLIVGAAFVAMAVWALVPDAKDEGSLQHRAGSVWLTTFLAFFVVEIGDKTQIATSLLAAQFHDIVAVTAGTTLGMMLANVPAVLLGERIVRLVPLERVRLAAAVLLAAIGGWILLGALDVA